MLKILFLLILVACNATSYINYDEYIEAEQASYVKNPIFTEMLRTTSPGEHSSYVQIGAFLPQNISSFESQTALHNIYALNMYLTNFDELRFLEIISARRTPLIIISHRDRLMPFDKTYLESFARNLGLFSTQTFIKFFPNARANNYNASDYVEFFKYARNVFREHAPHSIFVWNIFENDVLDSHQFFPGLDYVDWLGITQKVYLTEKRTHREGTRERFNFFYHNYFSLPIMVTFGVSHFSTINHSYHISEAVNFLKKHYDFLLNFPRVRAIIYSEENSLSSQDNFSITINQTILEAYNEAIRNRNIAAEAFFDLGGEEVLTLARTPYYEIVKKQ
ncbi:MAG: hypothetical protein FWF50_07025 [Defluviitaleaceae bacterium]|nr:hypothetical protein [Defluviitaleaceae bacterium]